MQGIVFLVENELLRHTSEDIAQFLYKGEGLNKTAIGDYLGERCRFKRSWPIFSYLLYTFCNTVSIALQGWFQYQSSSGFRRPPWVHWSQPRPGPQVNYSRLLVTVRIYSVNLVASGKQCLLSCLSAGSSCGVSVYPVKHKRLIEWWRHLLRDTATATLVSSRVRVRAFHTLLVHYI